MIKTLNDDGPMKKIKNIQLVFCTLLAFFISFGVAHANTEKSDILISFKGFLSAGDYTSANFYLSNSLVNPADLDTGQIFIDIYFNKQSQVRRNQTINLTEMGTLFNYLGQISPIDLNRSFSCNQNRDSCYLLSHLVTGYPVSLFKFFHERGLSLNAVYEGVVPATYGVIDRLGISYNLSDIQLLSSMGMAFGDEVYESVLLAAHGERRSYHYNISRVSRGTVKMPHNYLSVENLNFLDVLIVALANGGGTSNQARPERYLRDDYLCQYVSFAAASFVPSFDYLRYVLENRQAFKATNIGQRVRVGNTSTEAFASSCVALVAGMAQNHGRISEVISYFGANGDVETARWLLSLQPSNQQPVVTQTEIQAQPSANLPAE